MKNLDLFFLQEASGHFAISTIPDHWFEMSEEDQDQWLEDQKWEPMEKYSPTQIFLLIETLANSMKSVVNTINNNPELKSQLPEKGVTVE